MVKLRYSGFLVLAQLGLIGLIVSPLHVLWPPDGMRWTIAAFLLFVSLAVAIWAIISIGARSFSIMPEPAARAELTISGPYQYVRHPMYLGVLLACAGLCINDPQATNWLYFSLLAIVLILKIRREESLLLDKYELYRDYRGRSKALLPFVL